MRQVHANDIAAQPWRNGGGRTRELLAWPGADAWQLRVSVADIDRDGPFSAFGGVQRWFAVLEGAGVQLDIGGRPQRITRHDDALHFDGAAAPHCRLLDGPTRDLNLMLRNADGALLRIRPSAAWHAEAACCGVFSVQAGTWTCDDGRRAALPAFTLLWFDAAPDLPQRFDAPGWWLRCTPRERAQ